MCRYICKLLLHILSNARVLQTLWYKCLRKLFAEHVADNFANLLFAKLLVLTLLLVLVLVLHMCAFM